MVKSPGAATFKSLEPNRLREALGIRRSTTDEKSIGREPCGEADCLAGSVFLIGREFSGDWRMTVDDLRERLTFVACQGDGRAHYDVLCAELIAADAGLEAVATIVDFLESHDDRPTCCGGGFHDLEPLTHFAERFSGRGYQELLIESVKRLPRLQTVFMARRALNREHCCELRQQLTDVLLATLTAISVPQQIRAAAAAGLRLRRHRAPYDPPWAD